MTEEEKKLGYVTIKRFDHYGEKAVPTNNTREVGGVTEVEFIIMYCKHRTHKVWLRREDITDKL